MAKINIKEADIMRVCPFCGQVHDVFVNLVDYFDWEDGVLAQRAFPYLTPTEREQIISSICPDCQKDIFE